MPKDRAEVQDQYKIGGGSLNEYEFNQGKGEMEEQEHQTPEGGYVAEGLHGADEPNAPQNVAERIREVEQRAHEIVERRRAKAGAGKSASKSAKSAGKSAGKTAKKSASKAAGKSAKKAAKKPAASKGSKSGAGKKGTSKSAGKKSGGAKKGAGKAAGKKGAASKKGGARR
jgi:hypothetical protein